MDSSHRARTRIALASVMAVAGGAIATVTAMPSTAGAQQPQICFLNYDEGPVTYFVHWYVEPLAEPNASLVHGVSCTLREQLGL